tara:strand:- start:17 stop:265 length:249 start_codon:yes stop_codon:yes gene_type:complete
MIVTIGPEPPQAKIGADTVHKTDQHRHENEDHRDDDQIVQHLRQVGELHSAEQERADRKRRDADNRKLAKTIARASEKPASM